MPYKNKHVGYDDDGKILIIATNKRVVIDYMKSVTSKKENTDA